MGSSKKTQTTKPIYEQQITGAANTLSNVYNQNAAGVQQVSDQLGGLIPSMLDKYRQGDSAVNAARGFLTNTLESQPDSNPYLDQIVAQTGRNVADKTRTAMGTRGLTGGTVMQDIVSRNLAENESGLRYNDYAQAMQRKMQAAGMAPSIAAGDAIQIAPLLSVADAATSMPLDAATKYAVGTGGLLGQYTNTTQKSSGGLLGGLLGSVLGGWATGGFKGI